MRLHFIPFDTKDIQTFSERAVRKTINCPSSVHVLFIIYINDLPPTISTLTGPKLMGHKHVYYAVNESFAFSVKLGQFDFT
jgi:hypothetical protein